jgi:ribosomal protein S18 acetylase RimI-like enzyme
MISGGEFQIRPAVLTDQRQIANLIHFSSQVHRHLDWRSPFDWIGTPPYLVLENRGEMIAALACAPDPPAVAWLRLFVNSGRLPVQESWQLLWEKAHAELAGKGHFVIAAIVLKDWLLDILISNGFTTRQSIIMLERDGGVPVNSLQPSEISIRSMQPFDLPVVAEVDAAAFELLWQNALPVLERAYPQTEWATVAESNGQVIGYQLSTRHALGLHLARLAIRPSAQGKGLGYALVADLIERANQRGITHLTVNTQSDNATSLKLYQRLDFRDTGERYQVFEKQV